MVLGGTIAKSMKSSIYRVCGIVSHGGKDYIEKRSGIHVPIDIHEIDKITLPEGLNPALCKYRSSGMSLPALPAGRQDRRQAGDQQCHLSKTIFFDST
jgi:hypothetical protein